MNNSILHKISEAAKQQNITIDGLYYKFSDIFPESFYEVVIEYLKQAYPNFTNEPRINDFFIGFDKNKNAYFEFVGKVIDQNSKKEHNVRVIILEDYLKYECSFPPSLIKKENLFLETIKKLDEEKRNEILKNLPNEFKRRFIKEGPIEEVYEIIIKRTLDYINYLVEEKNKTYELLEKEINESKEIEQIYFFESEASTNSSKTVTDIPKVTKERKNEEIPFDERRMVLDNYSAEETFEARSKNSNSVYYVKVFKIKEKCKLVMEPVQGNKYTKVVYLDKDKLETGNIKKIVIDYLELSRNETTNTGEITRHSHTTLEEYKKLLEYLITGKNNGISGSTKIRIDEANNLKR